MRAAAELHLVRIVEFVSENFTAARADESVVALRVDHQNQVGKTVHQPSRKFLLLVQLPLNFAPRRYVHQRALVAHDFAGVVTHRRGRIQTREGLAILANQGDFAAFDNRLAIHFGAHNISQRFVGKNVRDFSRQQFVLRFVAKDADKRGIGVHDAVFRRNDINAFLQRLEKFGKTRFVAAQRGYVARKNGDSVHGVIADHRVSNAVEIKNCVAALQANLYDAGPVAAFQKTRHGFRSVGGALAAGFVQKFVEFFSDDLLKAQADEFGETPVGGANFAVERKRDQDIVERIDQVAVTLLRPADHSEELFVVLGRNFALLEAANEAAKFGNFAHAAPDVNAKQQHHHDEAKCRRFEAVYKASQCGPGCPDKSGNDN